MNLKEATQKVIEDIKTLKNPVISDWVEQIDLILTELGEPTIGRDKVVYVFFNQDRMLIRTEDNDGGCTRSNDMRIPLSVIESDNPQLAARDYKTADDIAILENDISRAERQLQDKRDRLEALYRVVSIRAKTRSSLHPKG